MGHQGEAERKEGDGERGWVGATQRAKICMGAGSSGSQKKKMGKGERMRARELETV